MTNTTDGKPTKQLFSSIRLYLLEYKDTSKSKVIRQEALRSAFILTHYVIEDILIHADDSYGAKMFSDGFHKLMHEIEDAMINQNHLSYFDDEIGFLGMLI